MAFKTYQCEKYIAYLHDHEAVLKDIYKVIASSPITKSELGRYLGYDYYAIHRRLKLKSLSCSELIKLLQFIK